MIHVPTMLTNTATENHIRWAEAYAPKYWGLMLAKEQGKRIVLSHIRKAGTNSNFSKRKALLILWKAELTAIANEYRKLY